MPKYGMPAFQFYVKDWLTNSRVILMTATERGAYINLLAHLWIAMQRGEGLLADDKALMRLSGCTEIEWGEAGTNVQRMFNKRGEHLFNERLTEEFNKHVKHREKCRAAGIASGKSRRQKTLSPEQALNERSTNVEPNTNTSVSSSVSTSPSSKPTNRSCTEPETDIRAVLEFETVGKVKTWNLTQAKLDEYQELYPGMSVIGECKKARQWIRDNPTRRKTAGGMTRMLGSWLSRAQNRGDYIKRDGSQPMSAHKRKVAAIQAKMLDNSDEAVAARAAGKEMGDV